MIRDGVITDLYGITFNLPQVSYHKKWKISQLTSIRLIGPPKIMVRYEIRLADPCNGRLSHKLYKYCTKYKPKKDKEGNCPYKKYAQNSEKVYFFNAIIRAYSDVIKKDTYSKRKTVMTKKDRVFTPVRVVKFREDEYQQLSRVMKCDLTDEHIKADTDVYYKDNKTFQLNFQKSLNTGRMTNRELYYPRWDLDAITGDSDEQAAANADKMHFLLERTWERKHTIDVDEWHYGYYPRG